MHRNKFEAISEAVEYLCIRITTDTCWVSLLTNHREGGDKFDGNAKE